MLLLLQSLVNGLLLGGIYASCSAGFSLAFGVMGVVNLSHGDFVEPRAPKKILSGDIKVRFPDPWRYPPNYSS